MRKKVFLMIFGMLVLVLSISVAQATVILSIVPSSEKVHIADQVNVEVVISGLLDDPATSTVNEDALGAFDLRMVYNPFVLKFNNLSFGDPVVGDQLDILGLGGNPLGFAEDPNPAIGAVDFFEVSLDSIFDLESLQSDSFTLATLSFIGVSSGFSSLNLAVPDLSDARGNLIPATVHLASIRVPEPETLALMSLGILVLGWTTKKRFKSPV